MLAGPRNHSQSDFFSWKSGSFGHFSKPPLDYYELVWTALHAEFGGNDRAPTVVEVVGYLRGLAGPKRDNAERYIRRAPRQVDTPLRRRIAAELNWTPADV